MATNIFKLVGEVSVNMNSFNTSMDAALTKVNNLATALNNLNGTKATVTVNQTGTGIPTAANGSASSGTGSTGGTTGSGKQSGTGTSGDAGSGGKRAVAPGSDGWTIGRGVVSQWISKAGEWAFGQIADRVGEGWERNIAEELTAMQIGTLTGLPESDAWGLVGSINEFARKTPLSVEGAWDAAIRLLNYGISPDEVIDNLWWLGDAARGDNTKMASIARAYTEVLGKDALYAQEGYQFINAGVPIFDLLEVLYASAGYNGPNKGLTSGEIRGGLNKDYRVPAADIVAAFEMATSEGGRYYNAMANMMGTMYGQEQLIDENVTNVAANLVAPFQDIVKNLINPAVVEMTGNMADATEAFGDISLDGDGTLISQFIGALGGDAQYALAPLTGFARGIANIPENASTFFDDWYNLLSLRWLFDRGTEVTDMYDEVIGRARETGRPEIVMSTLATDPEYESPTEYKRREKWNPMGGPGNADTIFFDDGHRFLPGATGASSVFTQLNAMPNQITAAVREGFNGATVTVNVTTGDVRLNEGTLVGSLAPRVDAILGAWNARAARG